MSKILVTKKHLIFSVNNALYPKTIHKTHNEVLSMLRELGIQCYEVQGQYDKPEISILVSSPSFTQKLLVTELAKKLGQESIIFAENGVNMLFFTNGENEGKAYYGKGTKFYTSEPDNYYTKIGNTYFSHNLDFSNLI